MSVVRYEPYGLINRFQNELNRLGWLDPLASDELNDDQSNVAVSQWRPSVDITEDENQFTIYADIPGVNPQEIDVTMENGVLSIKGTRSKEVVDEGKGFRRVERSTGSFYRRFSLPDTANAEKIEANSKDGVLKIVLPKHEKVQPRRIAINS
ncbi:MAG: Hsp20 family protein [Gammaproteobacteria bacterium]|nr:Hsp20 family protein [Gammaproteobacteria bacterium]